MSPPSLDFYPRAVEEARAARRWYARRSAADYRSSEGGKFTSGGGGSMPSVESRKQPAGGKKLAPRKPAPKKPAGKKPPAKKPPKTPPGPPAGSGGGGDEEHQRRLQEVYAKIDQALAESNVPPAEQKEYGETAKAILGKMTLEAVRRVHANVTGFQFYPTHEALTAAFKAKYPLASHKGTIKGAFDPEGIVHLNGGGTLHGRPAFLSEFYAEELTHGIDGVTHAISNTDDWKKAWVKEIRDTGIFGAYAASKPSEGFGAFGQYLLGHPQATRQNTKAICPQCLKVWEIHGL